MRVLRPLLFFLCFGPLGAAAQPEPIGPWQLVRKVAQAPATLPALPLKEAHRTLGGARQQFRQGLPAGAQLYVVARALNEAATPELLVVRVLGWQGPTLKGQIMRTETAAQSAPIELPESAVQDWLLLYTTGREEGNYLGKYWDLEERLAGQE
ncbi:hypothetical protein [Hymenobacter rigui]|uniref:Uncharacterized protein n=1 Tax=Hymenobacter rigui TaxID=334424 RepID=A0A3R9Q1C6_9BACT|nr:hypothetical protein [Hymenobacter rigui]RSK50844.1 hypothetical protein EI291_00555 [Hymenobacter rigui]